MTRGRDFIGSYRMVRLIRVGQSAEVWEAVSSMDNSRVALKVLMPDYRTDRDTIAYLKHEFEVGEKLDHPNIIKIHEYVLDRGIPFLVMEFFNSKNLKLILREGIEHIGYRAPEVIEQAAAGLSHLHEKGWIHRDVKPDNFLLNDKDEVKLIDLALAQNPKGFFARLFSGKSKIQGTRSYISPEQIRGKKVGFQADIYSFACMVFELVAGKAPFTASTPDELLLKHLKAPIPALQSVAPNVTPEFSNLIMKTMSKEIDVRPSTMKNFLKEFNSMRVYRTGKKPKPPSES